MCIGPDFIDTRFMDYFLNRVLILSLNRLTVSWYFKYGRICSVVLDFDPDELESSFADYCDCRRLMQNCDSPIDTCLKIDTTGGTDYQGLGYKKHDDIAEYTKQLRDMGHFTLRVRSLERYVELCHCCKCCCIPLLAYLVVKTSGIDIPVIHHSGYRPVHEPDLCQSCGQCSLVCPVNVAARGNGSLSDAQKDPQRIPNIPHDYCIGCGLCARKCPNDAICMVPMYANLRGGGADENKKAGGAVEKKVKRGVEEKVGGVVDRTGRGAVVEKEGGVVDKKEWGDGNAKEGRIVDRKVRDVAEEVADKWIDERRDDKGNEIIGNRKEPSTFRARFRSKASYYMFYVFAFAHYPFFRLKYGPKETKAPGK